MQMGTNQDYGSRLHRPYQCFMGRWEGLCKTFDAKGTFLEASAVHMNVYWVSENSWHLHEYFENLYEYGPADIHSDITVDGKACYGANEMVTINYTPLTLLRAEVEIEVSGVFERSFKSLRARNGIRHTFEGGRMCLAMELPTAVPCTQVNISTAKHLKFGGANSSSTTISR